VMCKQGCSGNNCLGACTSDAQCMAPTLYCQISSGECTATKPNGYACTSISECYSGFCVDGVCCDGKCDKQCQSCKGISGRAPAGSCGIVTGAVVTGGVVMRAGCNSDGTSCGGRCDGTSPTCVYPQSDTLCQQGCHAGQLDSCNGQGNCATRDCQTQT